MADQEHVDAVRRDSVSKHKPLINLSTGVSAFLMIVVPILIGLVKSWLGSNILEMDFRLQPVALSVLVISIAFGSDKLVKQTNPNTLTVTCAVTIALIFAFFFLLSQPGTIVGHMLDWRANGQQEYALILEDDGGVHHFGKIDPEGKFEFRRIPAGQILIFTEQSPVRKCILREVDRVSLLLDRYTMNIGGIACSDTTISMVGG